MIKNLDELWNKMQIEFDKINQQFKDIDKRFEQIDERFEQIDKRFEQIDKRFEQIDKRFEQIDKRFEQIDKRFEQIDERFEEYNQEILDIKNNAKSEFAKVYKVMEEGCNKMDERFARIEDKLDIMTNTNLAQILNKLTETKAEVTETKEELTIKLDKHIEINEFEHKKFDYKLADMELKYKYND